VNCCRVALDRHRSRAVVKTTMHFRVPWKTGISSLTEFLIKDGSVSLVG
jgi:hypothetical protein